LDTTGSGRSPAGNGSIVTHNEINAAQMTALARFTPVNSLAMAAVALITGAILWPVAPKLWVATWTLLLVGPSLWMLYRWQRFEKSGRRIRGSDRGVRKAQAWALFSGAMWGAGSGFLLVVPPMQQTALLIVAAAMIGSSVSTLAPMPRAAIGFILASLTPYIVWYASRGELVHMGLALQAVVMATALLLATRQVYRTFLDDVRVRKANADLLAEFEEVRQQWLEISDTTDAFALFDSEDKLLIWNQNYAALLSIPPEQAQRGARRASLHAIGAKRVETISDIGEVEGHGNNGPLTEIALLDNGKWVRSYRRTTPNGHMIDVHADVTELVAREIALRDSQEALRLREKFYRSLLENTSDVITVLNGEGKITFQSASSDNVLGYPRADMLNRNAFELVHPDDAGAVQTLFRELSANAGEGARAEFRMWHKENSWRVVAVTARNAMDVPGIEGIIVNSRDVTTLRQQQDQLREAQRMESIGQLTGGVAHDFNNLLTVIIGNLELARQALPRDHSVQKMLAAADMAANRGATLTKDLLSFARRQALSPTVFKSSDLLERMKQLLERTLGSEIDIDIHSEDNVWPVDADEAQLRSAIVNLAINARDAMIGGGRLTIGAANRTLGPGIGPDNTEVKAGDYVALTVTDTGTGMAPEVVQRVFDPFFTTKEPGKGSGLGLSMVLGFARQSGGHVEIDSTPNVGTSVTIFLPRAIEELSPAETEDSEDDAQSAGKHTTVLVVEDDDLVRKYATTALEMADYQVYAAKDGEAALAILADGVKPDLLLCDVVLPGGMTGRQVSLAVRERLPDIPVLFVSGYTRETLSDEGRLLEGVDLITKPYTPKDLIERIQAILSPGGGIRSNVIRFDERRQP
jgi:PAS domain S-box-containing protein